MMNLKSQTVKKHICTFKQIGFIARNQGDKYILGCKENGCKKVKEIIIE